VEERALGGSGLEVSVITFGAMGSGGDGFATPTHGQGSAGPSPDEESARVDVILAALDAGVTAIDTAPLYGFGRSEKVVGRAIRSLSRKPRILTKVGLRWDSAHGEPLFTAPGGPDGTPIVVRRDSRPESVLLEIERSLDRLRVSRLDLVQVHHRDRSVPIGETMGALRDAVQSASVRAVGVCNYSAREIEEARVALRDVPLASVQSPFSLLAREVEHDALHAAASRGIGFLAYSPLAQGLLTGAYGPSRRLAESDWRRELPLFEDAMRTRIADVIRDVVVPIAARHGATPSQIALAWLLARGGVTTAIAGASTVEQARENAEAGALRIEPSELAPIEEAFARLARGAGRRRTIAVVRRMVTRILRSPRG
jgi:aryl-alcohol dehydrogenase-like predicted oxidoreductase